MAHRLARLTDGTSAWCSRPLPSAHSARPWTGQKSPTGPGQEPEGTRFAGSTGMGRYRRRLILTRACGGDQTHLGWTASRERQQTAGRQSGLSPGCALLPAALPGLEELGTSPGPQETCQGHLLSPDDPSPRSLCCPAPAECCRQLENLALLLPSERSLLSLVCAHTLRSHLSDSNRRAGGASSSGLGCWEAEAPGVNSSPAAESSARVFGQHAAYSTEKKPEANSTISRF